MQFMTSLLGGSGNSLLTSVFALGIVLVLIVLGLWALKLTMRTTGTLARGRGRRLQVVEQLQLDSRRQLVIVRRDEVEHLLVIGGPQDLVVEAGFATQQLRTPASADPTHPTGPASPKPAAPAPLLAARPHIERLKEFARPVAQRKSPSLRHTGLLRPVSVMEPAVIPLPPMAGDNAVRGRADSATRPTGTDDNGRTGLVGSRDHSSGRNADSP